jgi:hypothetical protein
MTMMKQILGVTIHSFWGITILQSMMRDGQSVD